MDVDQIIAEIERLERTFALPDTRTAESKRPLGCESQARREASTQPVVPALAGVWSRLPP